MLRSDLCGFINAYIVFKGMITLTKATAEGGFIDIRNKSLAFKSNALFTNCISKINNVLTDNAEDLDVVMLVYNLLEYSKNYRKTTGILWNYYRDEPNDFPANSYNANIPSQIPSLLNTKAELQEKHQMQIKKTLKTLNKKIQRLKQILKLLLH